MKFGARVKYWGGYTRIVERRDRNRPESYIKYETWKTWIENKVPETEGIYLGTRTLQNGVRYWEGDDMDGGYYIFEARERFQVALVCSPGKNPRYVPLTAVEEIGGA